MKRKITISYNWWNSSETNAEIPPEHQDALEEKAQDRIAEQMTEGNTSGQLLDNISMLESDGDDGVDYQGHWESTIEVD